MQEIDVTGSTDVRPAAVWRLLSDSSTWPTWTSIDRYEPVRPAGADGLGEIRLFHTGRHTVREEIVERESERRLTYTLLAGLALRDYRAEIDLTPRPDGGTDVHWHTTFRAKVLGLGPIYRRALDTATRAFVAGLLQAAAEVTTSELGDAGQG